jgi:hypothetical protein
MSTRDRFEKKRRNLTGGKNISRPMKFPTPRSCRMSLGNPNRREQKKSGRSMRASRNLMALSAAIGAGVCAAQSHAAVTTLTWDGESSTSDGWSHNNWNGLTLVSGEAIVFAGSSRLTATNDETTTFTIAGITFNSAAGIFNVSGNAIILNTGITDNQATNLETLTLPIQLSGINTISVVSGGKLTLGGALNNSTALAGGLTLSNSGLVTLSGASTYTAATTVSKGKLALTGSLGNTPISVANGATFAPASGTFAGSTATSTAGATLNLNALSIFTMQDTSVGTFSVIGGATFPGTALTLGGATLNFDLGASGTNDELIVKKGSSGGVASVTGTQTINVDALSSLSSLSTGAYTLISAGSGLNAGTFTLGSTSLTVGTHTYTLSLSNSATAETLTVANAVTTTATTYNLSATTGGLATTSIHVAGASTSNSAIIASQITNAGTGTADTLNYTGLTATSSAGGTIAGTAANGGPLAQGVSGNTGSAITFSSTTAGAYTVTPKISTATDATLGGSATAGTTATETVKVYNLASPTIASNTITLGNVHVGNAFGTGTVSLTNSAASGGFSESLDASFGSGSGATGSGTISQLAAQGSNNTSLIVGLTGAAVAGNNQGTIGLNLTSDGTGTSGLANTGLTGQTITIKGAGYNLASATLTSTSISLGNVHVGSGFGASALNLTNGAPGTFSESLDASFGAATGAASGSGTVNLLGGSANNHTSLLVGLGTATAGANSGTIALNLTSDGSGTSGLASTTLTSKTITVSGTAYNLASANVSSPINLGPVHVGNSFAGANLSVSNAAPSTFSESLDASFGSASNVTASGSINQLAAGAPANTSSMLVDLSGTAVAGTNTGSVVVNLTSDGTGSSGLGTSPLSPKTVTVTGTGYRLASLGGVPVSTIDFGDVFVNSSASQSLSLTNNITADQYSENLDVAINSLTGNATGSGSIHLLNPGLLSSGISVGIDTSSAGAKSGTVILTPTSNASGIAGDTLPTTTEGNQSVSVTGNVLSHAVVTAADVDLGHVLQGSTVNFNYSLANQAPGGDGATLSSITGGGNGYNVSFAAATVLQAGQVDSFGGTFQAGYDQGGGQTYTVTYGDTHDSLVGALANEKTTFSIGAIVDPIVVVSDASDAQAAGRSILSGTPTPGNAFGSTDPHTVYVIRNSPDHYVFGGLSGLNTNKGYVDISVTDSHGDPSSFTEGSVVALFDFGVSDQNDSGLVSLETDLTSFNYTWFDIWGRNGANGVLGSSSDLGQLAFIPGYQLEVDLPLGGDPVLSFDFSKYSDLNVHSLAVVPEPTSMSLVLLGGLGFLGRRRRKI